MKWKGPEKIKEMYKTLWELGECSGTIIQILYFLSVGILFFIPALIMSLFLWGRK